MPSEQPSDQPSEQSFPRSSAQDLEQLAASTQRFLESAHSLDETTLREPSLLPDWSRAHVLAHVAGNAAGLTNLATWASTGVVTPQYASRDERDRAITEGAAESLDTLLRRVETSSEQVADALAAIPDDRMDVQVQFLSGATVRARRLLAARMREVEIHHVDLGLGYEPSDWPSDFVADTLHSVVRTFDGRSGTPGMTLEVRDTDDVLTIGAGGPPTLSGSQWRLLAWLTGRQDGRYLVVSPAGPVPTLPPWS